ncbi:MAG: SDR family oxidoreductase [Anaerolineae bacterium]|nr:SDR family oxidoreductase [Anaerolineae bacterium]
MELGLAGKVAAITGGSEGIGKAVAWRLSQEGAHVAICARRADVLEHAAQDIREATGGKVLAYRADVTRPDDLAHFIEATVRDGGRLDILVNNAGRRAGYPFLSSTDEAWQSDFDLKVFAALRATRLAIPHMMRAGGGRVINVTHIGGKQPGAGSMPSSVSRAAGIALTKALSKELAEHKILVNTVCVGVIRSAQTESGWREQAAHLTLAEYEQQMARGVPLKRIGEAEEVADLVAFLVSARASYITGTAINVDGGASGVV